MLGKKKEPTLMDEEMAGLKATTMSAVDEQMARARKEVEELLERTRLDIENRVGMLEALPKSLLDLLLRGQGKFAVSNPFEVRYEGAVEVRQDGNSAIFGSSDQAFWLDKDTKWRFFVFALPVSKPR